MEEKEYELSSDEYILIKEEAIRHYLSSQTTFPDRLKSIRKDYGIFFTPQYIVDLMVSLIDRERFSNREINILEPACGLAQFLIGIKRNFPLLYEKARLFGVEINKEIADYLSALIKKSLKLLRENGQLIFIVPATFMILDEFKKLRGFLSQNGGTAIIYLGAEVFKPEADVACVILNYIKSPKFAHRLELFEYEDGEIKQIKLRTNWQGEVITFETDWTKKMESLCKYRLGEIYDVRISPRTPEIKNNPLIVKSDNPPSPDFLPILNGRNLKRNQVIYENYTGYWIKANEIQKLRAFFGLPHIVVGLGFREGGKVAAGYDHKGYPWMGDVYHLIRKNSLFTFDMNEREVVEYLNSEYVSRYVKEVYREITYHLSITQLENIPLPTRN
ncbi:N-6 DNA methylase [bacterium]|nr:N-6 DNA methylase [bacterium]